MPTVPERARDSCMAMSASMVRWRSRASGSLGLYARERVGESRGRVEASLISLPTLWRRRTGDWSVLMGRGELEIEPERTEDVSGGEAMAAFGPSLQHGGGGDVL